MRRRPRNSLQTESVALENWLPLLDAVSSGSLTPECDPVREDSGSIATCREWKHMIPPIKTITLVLSTRVIQKMIKHV